MDIATLVGTLLGFAFFGYAIGSNPAGFGPFIDIGSLMITIGGMFAGICIAYPMNTVMLMPKLIIMVHLNKPADMIALHGQIQEMATIARRDGILALEEKVDAVEDVFLKKGLQMLVDGSPPEVIVAILSKELDTMEERHMLGSGLIKNMGAYAPAFGMVGTLIGLIQMLQDLSDPAALGLGMAVALMTTLYGAFFANMFFIPWSNKLLELHNMEMCTLRMLLEGMLAIQAGDAPRVVSEKMLAYMSPAQRKLAVPEEA